jgi:hypothetical protein
MAQSQKKETNNTGYHPANKDQRFRNRHMENSFPHHTINNVQNGGDYKDEHKVSERDRVFYRSNIDDWQG